MQSALQFLSQLEANNNRDWFQAHKDEYEQSREEFVKMVGEVLAGTAAFEPHLAGLEAKNCVFRGRRAMDAARRRTQENQAGD